MSNLRTQTPEIGDTPTVRGARRVAGVVGAMLWLASAPAPAQEPSTAEPAPETGAPVAEEQVEEPPVPDEVVEPPSDVEVIRVKGRAVTAIEADVPESVTQFDAKQIEALGAQNISDLAKVTPNVEITTASATTATFFIRGVGLSDFSSNAAGAVAIYQDDVSLNAPALQLGQLFDIENVEVLRGPQGSGPGRNATAGAIKITSRRPTGDWAANLRSSLGSYYTPQARNAMLMDYEGAVELPILEEVLAARFSFRLQDGDPYIENRCGDAPPFEDRVVKTNFPSNFGLASICGEAVRNNQISTLPTGLDRWVGDKGSWAARGILRFQPKDTEMDWVLNGHGSRLDQRSTLGQAVGTGGSFGVNNAFGGAAISGYREPDQQREFCQLRGGTVNPVTGTSCLFDDPGSARPGDEARDRLAQNLIDRPMDLEPYQGDFDLIGPTKLDTWGVSLRGDLPIGPAEVTTITGYDAYKRSRVSDVDFTPDPAIHNDGNDDEAWQVMQEVRVGYEFEDYPVRLETGGYYLHETLNVDAITLIRGMPRDLAGEIQGGTRFGRVYTQKLNSYAVYGSFSWDFLDDFTLDGGVRYNWEMKDFDFTRTQLRNVVVSTDTQQEQQTWQAPTGAIRLSYRFNDAVSAYWKYGRGFKGGHFNANSSALTSNAPADPEYIDSFEVGFAGRWLDGRLALRGAAFHYDYKDYQVFRFVNEPDTSPTLEVVNAQRAELYGAELDMRTEPLTGWSRVPEWLENLVLDGRLGWLESEFLEFTSFSRVTQRDGTVRQLVLDFSGNPLISSPRFKASGSAEWTFDFGRWGSIVPRYDFAWSDRLNFDASGGRGGLDAFNNPVLPDGALAQRAFFLHNLRLSYRTPEGNVEVSVWCRNLTDEVYRTYAFDTSAFAKVVVNFLGEPRTVGIDLSLTW